MSNYRNCGDSLCSERPTDWELSLHYAQKNISQSNDQKRKKKRRRRRKIDWRCNCRFYGRHALMLMEAIIWFGIPSRARATEKEMVIRANRKYQFRCCACRCFVDSIQIKSKNEILPFVGTEINFPLLFLLILPFFFFFFFFFSKLPRSLAYRQLRVRSKERGRGRER